MRRLEDTLRAMARNRQQLEQAVLLIRQNSALADADRRALLTRTWVRSMKRHYRLLDDFLEQRQLALEQSNRGPGRATAPMLEAPERPAEVPEWCSRYI